nr:ribonuclease H-like domain-containing protein [Tanacetum cinerariifolium]
MPGIALILKTKGGLKYISFNDLYNKLKFLEIDTKRYSSSSPTLSNAAFVCTAGSSQGNLSYQESRNGSYGGYGGYTTTLSASPGFSSSKGSSKSKCSVVDDVLYSFFANHEIDQQLVHRFEKKHGWKIKFNCRENARFDKKLVKCFNCKQMGHFSRECRAQENARFDKKLVKCFNCKQMGHFSRECRAQGAQTSNNYQKYKSKEAGKDGSDSKAMVVVDGSIDWDKQTEESNTEPRSLENFGMVAGLKIASDADSEGEVVSADDAIPTGVSVSAGLAAAAAISPQSETKFALIGLSNEAHKHAVKSLEKQIKCHQTNQLVYEEKIRVVSYELEE